MSQREQPALDKVAVKRQEELRRERNNRERADLQFVMGHQQGRRFVWKLLSETGMFEHGFIPNGSEQYYRAGKRDVGLALLGVIHKDFPDMYQLMQNEAIQQQKLDQALKLQAKLVD